jgi:hypothetical protein
MGLMAPCHAPAGETAGRARGQGAARHGCASTLDMRRGWPQGAREMVTKFVVDRERKRRLRGGLRETV